MVILLFLIVVSIFIYQPHAKENINPSQTETYQMLEKLKEKSAKYKIGTYNISNNDITINIVGSQEYYHSVKDEVKEIVENTIKSTSFEKYPIYIDKAKIANKEVVEGHRLMQEISTTIDRYLAEFYNQKNDEIQLEDTSSEFNIEIKTPLNEKQKESSIGKDMERNIYIYLEEKLPLNKLLKERKINISINNKDGEKIN